MMKKQPLAIIFMMFTIIFSCTMCTQKAQSDYPVKPAPFTEVQFSDDFWLPRMETNRKVTIPYAFEQSEETGRVKNFEIAGGTAEGGFCSVYPFDDSDVYKIIEGASYSLKIHTDPKLEKYLDELIAKIGAAQEDDGYLYTARTIFPEPPKVRWVDTKERWANMYLGHELYNVGHMYEAAVAHFQATGKRAFLDIAIKNADLIESVFGPGKKIGVPGHQEIEIGLVKLYRVTSERKYLDLAKFFLDERGYPHERELYGEYSQDHMRVTEQTEPVGHAVRAAYMYSGMADVAALTEDEAYRKALETLWNNVVSKKMYLTGGIGSQSGGESFGEDYELPNASAYCETCAAIAHAFWNHRMFLLSGDAKYLDVLERVLYNGIISGIALTGDLFFYPNPLESHGQHERSPWFTCACCPSNVTRFVPSVPGYVYATQGDDLFVNLFDSSDQKAVIHVNGEPYDYILERGFARINRKWVEGDTVDINLPLSIRRVLSHKNVEENTGKVALERGPIVYCAEWVDNNGFVSNLVLDDTVQLRPEKREDLFNGVIVFSGKGAALIYAEDGKTAIKTEQNFTAIPYYAWAHRGKGEMAVWIPRDESKSGLSPGPLLPLLVQ
jgi:DUF1680 family protein